MKFRDHQIKRKFVVLLAALIAFSNLGTPHAQVAHRRPPQRVVEEEQGNLSALHYAPRHNHTATEDGDDDHGIGEVAGLDAVADVAPAPVVLAEHDDTPHWNSPAGREAVADLLAISPDAGGEQTPGETAATTSVEADGGSLNLSAGARRPLAVAFDGQNVCTVPSITIPGAAGSSFAAKDQLNDRNVSYRQPYHVFTLGPDIQREIFARDFAATVRASMPMFLPYKNSHVYPGQGWIYNSGNFHGGIDFSRDDAQEGKDATFAVYSVAEGKVVSILWNDTLGNIVIIEHTAPNGDRYRTVYMHMRNGFTHDLAKAKAVPSGPKYNADGDVTLQYRYYLYAHQANPNPLYWGTDYQTIKVTVGQKVAAGTQIGWTGNTGWGGAGLGLDDNGNPSNKATANNHLHLTTTVPDPRPTNPNDWVFVDPFGVYAKMNTGCYDLLDDTPYARLFAPFYSSFHNVPYDVVLKYFGYYPGMGMALQTISLHRKGNDVLASGSFQSGLSPQWKARLYMTGADFQYWFDQYKGQDYRPREISVTRDGGGNPRYNVIWKKRAGEGYYTHFGLTDAEWKQKVTDHVTNGGMVIDEHVVYDTGGGTRHAGVFVTAPQVVTYDAHLLILPVFNSLLPVLKAQGYKQTDVYAEEFGGGWAYGGIWRKVAGQWAMEYDLTPQEYQDAFEDYAAQGYRLYRVQGYADSSRFAATWTK